MLRVIEMMKLNCEFSVSGPLIFLIHPYSYLHLHSDTQPIYIQTELVLRTIDGVPFHSILLENFYVLPQFI
jgi:hypothetical protein